MDRNDLLRRVDRRWQTFLQSISGLHESAMLESGVVGAWSIKDLIGHVTTWEEETLAVLPVVVDGAPMPRYGDIDAFNSRESARKSQLPLEVLQQQLYDTHRRLLEFLSGVNERHFATETRFRKRLRLDTYGHYREHTEHIAAWRGKGVLDRSEGRYE